VKNDILIIGAGPAGLAVAGSLAARGLQATVVERAGDVGASWRGHYDRLRLHTVKQESALPGMPFPKAYPRYVTRAQMVDYLSAYAARFGIVPRFGCEVTSISPAGGQWRTETRTGETIVSRTVVLATGANAHPLLPEIAGRERFAGTITHSRDYRHASAWQGRRVLVVGMGNTGAEIALDLAEHAIAATLSVRSPVNIVRRDVLGRPTQLTSILISRLPEAWGDAIARVFRDLTIGDLGRWGLRTSPVSPLRDLRRFGRTPVIDVGTVARIKAGDIRVRPNIEMLTATGARFVDGSEQPFDAIILATGYRARLQQLFPQTELPLDERGLPTTPIATGALAGLYFVGFDIRQPGGLLRAIGLQAQTVADAVAGRVGHRIEAGHAIAPSGESAG
jgi:cation diffusion facilitator CzcD-associated flavoprotein CzcO